jgi:NAD(P)-dependent dehydrogenase (short-subunit alcohol dehydrogenase family)
MDRIAIVTGVSRGLGESLALDLLGRGWGVLGVGRHDSTRLAQDGYRFVQCDLADAGAIDEVLERPFADAARASPRAAVLVSNAAAADPVGIFGRMGARELATAMSTNLAAPVALANLFCRTFTDPACDRRIINISSGAAERTIPGLGPYSVAKAGLEMLTRCVALEQGASTLRAITLRPGIIDTQMQVHARSHSPTEFPSVDLFQNFHASGQLVPPQVVARKTIDRLLEAPVESGRTYNYAEL